MIRKIRERPVREGASKAQDATGSDAGDDRRSTRSPSGASRAKRLLGTIHPAFMSGTYLAPMDGEEVEVLRVTLKSVTGDVTSVRAKRTAASIRYRVVDEYEGETLRGRPICYRKAPMSLDGALDFLLRHWPLMTVLRINAGADVQKALAFFWLESSVYPDAREALIRRVKEEFLGDT